MEESVMTFQYYKDVTPTINMAGLIFVTNEDFCISIVSFGRNKIGKGYWSKTGWTTVNI